MVHFDDNSKMPFGKYEGYKLANVPPEYFIYILDKGYCFGALKEYIEKNKETLEKEIKLNKKMYRR